jgi:hypothetical protein
MSMKDARAEIKNAFVQYLAKDLSLEDFQERIALAHWSIERAAPDMAKLVYCAVGKLSELSLGHRTEQSLREELANAIRPFAPSPIPAQPEYISSWGSKVRPFRIGAVEFQQPVIATRSSSPCDVFLIRAGG